VHCSGLPRSEKRNRSGRGAQTGIRIIIIQILIPILILKEQVNERAQGSKLVRMDFSCLSVQPNICYMNVKDFGPLTATNSFKQLIYMVMKFIKRPLFIHPI
jgi:hypothetical protein